MNVLQVTDKTTMFVKVCFTADSFEVKGGATASDLKTAEVLLMEKNLPSKGATDGVGFDLPRIFEATDTKPTRPPARRRWSSFGPSTRRKWKPT
ncbi:hypothetical protein GobsT_32180 [Gemmata obscuriglobus]|nr:hypothetical protein GobsT_32180 [Gemmata obscuriglobus]VTS06416.1 unnamed protein product [Gemmata obscuriglobus UQM 2246]